MSLKNFIAAACALFCAFIVVSAPAQQPQTQPAVPGEDAKTEISASVYYMASVVQALSKEYDAKIKAKTQRIQVLNTRLRTIQAASVAESAKLRTERAALQDEVVAQLAARDAELARQVAAFRKDVQSIADTPDGLEALRLFNAGQWRAADAIFQRIIAAVDRAEALATALRRAAPRRQRARLANEARERAQVTTKEVIALFEEVTRLDPGNSDDWFSLARLYPDDGRYDEALAAARRMMETSRTDAMGTIMHYAAFADVVARREPARAEDMYKLLVEGWRNFAKVDKDAEWFIGLMLSRLGTMQMAQKKYPEAEKSLTEALPILRRGRFVSSQVRDRRLAQSLQALGAMFLLQSKPGEAEPPLLEAVAIWRREEKQDPNNTKVQSELAGLYFNLSVTAGLQGNREKRLSYRKDEVAIRRKLVAWDGSYANRSGLADNLYFLGDATYQAGLSTEAEQLLTESSAIMRALVQEKPRAEETEQLATVLLLLSKVALGRDDPVKAATLAQEAVGLRRPMVSDQAHKADLADALVALGIALDRGMAFTAARPVLEEAIGLLSIIEGKNTKTEQEILSAYQSVLYGLGKAGDGIGVFERSLANARRLAAASPKDARLRVNVIMAAWRVGYAQLARRELGPAAATFDDILAAVAQIPESGFQSFMNAAINVPRGDIERLQDRSAAAIARYEEAIRLYVKNNGANPKDPSDLFDLLEPKFRIAQLKADRAALAEIVATYQKFGGRRGVRRWTANWFDDLEAVANQKR